jgi:hypothetical protein
LIPMIEVVVSQYNRGIFWMKVLHNRKNVVVYNDGYDINTDIIISFLLQPE